MSRPTDSLITDRTSTDVSSKTAKGYYNATDLNRIGTWQVYLAELLNSYGYSVSILTPKTNWTVGDLPRQADINRIKNNLTSLKNAFYVLSTTPSVPSTTDTSINYTKANNMEKLMADIDTLIANMSVSFRYANFLIAGDDLGMPNIEN